MARRARHRIRRRARREIPRRRLDMGGRRFRPAQVAIRPGFKTTFGSRKEVYVDRIGDPDSIFGKLRLMLDRLPHWMLPQGLNRSEHDNFMRLLNPANGNAITGEAGDNMGRGGRSTFTSWTRARSSSTPTRWTPRSWRTPTPESGHPPSTARATSSTASGTPGHIPVFRFHWSDDPRKDAAWADGQATGIILDACDMGRGIRHRLRRLGRRNLHPRQVGGILPQAGQGAQPRSRKGPGVAGLDVGAGRAKSVLIPKFGPVVLMPTAWQTVDNIQTTYAALDVAQQLGVTQIKYDAAGVGNTVTSTLVHANTGGVTVTPVNVGIPPTETLMPDGRMAVGMVRQLRPRYGGRCATPSRPRTSTSCTWKATKTASRTPKTS